MEDQKNCVAIIGMGLLLPDAVNQEEFYNNLKTAKDSVTGPSLERLVYSSIVPGKQYRPGAYLGRIDQFDHKFFKISKKEAEFMDPTQRILLELACTSIENAGYAIDDFRDTDTAVYLCSNTIYPMVYQMKIESVHAKPDPTIHTGTLNSMISGRISYSLGLTGPSVMIDSGCSSAVVALNEAVEKLISGSISAALVGGLVLKTSAHEVGNEGHLGAASKSGKSRAFDAEADGIGTGEGGGIVLIKRLDHAIRDNDNIQAVIKGIGISQDGGRCNSIAAPSPVAQTSAIKKAWDRAKADPRSISYIETHGAGTHLGDVIEVQALSDAFGAEYAGEKICALGAVKTNIGHIGNAAGIAGIIKAVISLKKKELFPCLHFKTPNPFIDFEHSPVYVNTEFKGWEKTGGYPRRCGVSSFGLSGTNGHVVLEEHDAGTKTSTDHDKGLFLKIAAKSGSVWEDYRQLITNYLEQTDQRLEDVLYTLNSGRTDYACRFGFYGDNREQLLQQLNNFSAAHELSPVKNQAKSVVLLFSPGAYSKSLIEKLYNRYHFFKNTFDTIKELNSSFGPGSAAETMAVQLGLYKQIVQTGISIKTVIGNGIGSITTQVISGGLSLADAIDLIRRQEVPTTPVDETRLKKLVKEFPGNGHTMFVELGAENIFYDKLSACSTELSGLELLPCLDDNYTDPLLAKFTDLYNNGVTIDWKKYYNEKTYARVEAPTYPFERIRCWYEEAADPSENTIGHSLYEHDWRLNEEECQETIITGQTFLLFAVDQELSENVMDLLRRNGNRCIGVRLADRFKKDTDDCFEIDGRSENDYARLRELLTGDKVVLNGIIHLGTYTAPYQLSVNNHTTHLEKSFVAQYLAAKVFADNLVKTSFYYSVLTANANKITEKDKYIAPLHAMSAVLAKSLMAEYPAIRVSCLDLSYNEYIPARAAALLIREMSHDNLLRFAAVRNDKRYTPVLVSVPVQDVNPATGFNTVNGVYIVTGGASGIGLETCKALATAGPAHFIITGRSILPSRETWDHIVLNEKGSVYYERISGLQSLQQLGVTFEYHVADAGDTVAMRVMFDEIGKRFTKITGIIHAAGLGNSGTSIKQRAGADMIATLSPKITGSLVLEEFSRNLRPEFFLLFSSIAVLVPSKGSADYSSANSFEDAFAHSMRLANKRFISIDWSDWKETGLAYRKRLQRGEEVIAAREKVVKGLTNKEGILAIRYALALDKPQLAVANADMSSFAINPFFGINDTQENTTTAGIENTARANVQAVENIAVANMEGLTEVESKLAMIWHEVLKLDSVKPDDDFYELGGHSLNITQMLNKIKKVFGVALEMDEMLYNNTVRLLAARIEDYIAKGNVEEYERIMPVGDFPYYDISHAQKRFWIVSQQAGREAYNVPAAYVFTGKLDRTALERAFQLIVERHESLRTSFVLVDGIPRQQIHPMTDFDFRLHYSDIRFLAAEPDAVQQLLQSEAAIPFDLEAPPLLRIKLFQLEENRYLFFMNMHHIVADATSVAVIRNEALIIYKAITQKQEIKLEGLSIQYKDFAAWQNRQLKGEKLAKYKNYWLNRLQGNTPIIQLPADYHNSDRKNGQSARVRIVIDKHDFPDLKKIAERNSTSLFTLSLAIFNVLLYKYTGMADLVVGTPVNGREHNDLDKQVGSYLNTLLLRTTIHEASSFNDLLQQVRENTWKDLAHQLYPYDLLTEDMRLGHFNIGFTWTVRELVRESMGLDFEIEEMPTGFGMAKNDLWLFGVEFKESLILEFMYKTAIFKPETIGLMAERLHILVTQIIEDPSRKIRELHIKTIQERKMEQQQEVIEFNF